MAKTSIVILNYNGEGYLRDFLPSVIEYSKDAEIIVADNASTDRSIEVLKTDFPSIKTILLSKNLGFAGGYNAALKQVDSEYYVLLNSDVEVTENWLGPMVDFLDGNPDYVAAQPKIKDYKEKKRFEYAGASGGFIDSMGYPYSRGRVFNTIELDSNQYNNPIDIFWASGASLVVRASSFHEVGGFDEDFFAHMEEIDLCWRFKSKRLKVRAIPNSTVYHVGGGTLAKSSPFKTYLNFRNGLYLLIKNLPKSELFFKFPLRIVLDWIASAMFLLNGQPKHSIAVFKAHCSVIANFLSTLRKRKLVSSTGNNKLIIWNYFLLKKRTFNQI